MDDSLRTDQYADASTLGVRGQFNERFTTADRHPLRWTFDHVDAPPAADVLGVGCGAGALWTVNADRVPGGWDLALTDFSPGMVRDAGDAVGDAGVEATVRFAVAAAGAVPLADASCDAVTATQMLYHVPDRERAYADVCRVLRDDGVLYATTTSRENKARLYDLMDGAAAADIEAPAKADDAEFSVETAGEEIRERFGSVERHVRSAPLVVEGEGAVDLTVAYARSMAGMDGVPAFTDEDAERLRASLADELADGPLELRRDYGLFVARP
jgi:SAM-dependent methyltransferase